MYFPGDGMSLFAILIKLDSFFCFPKLKTVVFWVAVGEYFAGPGDHTRLFFFVKLRHLLLFRKWYTPFAIWVLSSFCLHIRRFSKSWWIPVTCSFAAQSRNIRRTLWFRRKITTIHSRSSAVSMYVYWSSRIPLMSLHPWFRALRNGLILHCEIRRADVRNKFVPAHVIRRSSFFMNKFGLFLLVWSCRCSWAKLYMCKGTK